MNATILPPTGSAPVPGSDLGTSVTGPFVASTGVQPFMAINSLGQVTMSGTYEAFVEQDPNNVFCAGCLDFFFVVNNSSSSSDSTARITDASFSNFLTDVGYTTGPGSVSGGVLPSTVDRSSNGDVVGFDFNVPMSVAPGQSTQVLEVETNARFYMVGSLQIIDGAVATVQSFQPCPLVPEPATLSITLLGIAGIFVRRRWAAR
jgi:hypothetical protein